MFFEQHVIGAMQNFGYVIGDPATKVAAVVDPSFDARILQKVAGENGYAIGFIFDTHHHPDHVFDNERLANETGAKVAAHRLSNVRKDLVLEDGMVVKVGELKVKVVHTPGHSPDSCCYLVAGHAFTGTASSWATAAVWIFPVRAWNRCTIPSSTRYARWRTT